MSGIYRSAVTAQARLACDVLRCGAVWMSVTYKVRHHQGDVMAAAPAFAAGWRVFAAARGQRTYCPEHGPSTAMRLINGPTP